jgi:hypothetical protein
LTTHNVVFDFSKPTSFQQKKLDQLKQKRQWTWACVEQAFDSFCKSLIFWIRSDYIAFALKLFL